MILAWQLFLVEPQSSDEAWIRLWITQELWTAGGEDAPQDLDIFSQTFYMFKEERGSEI